MFETPHFSIKMDGRWNAVNPDQSAVSPAGSNATVFDICEAAQLSVKAPRETLIQFDLLVARTDPTRAFGIYQGDLELLALPAEQSGPGVGPEAPRPCRIYFAAAIGFNPIDFRMDAKNGSAAQPVRINFEGFRVLSS